MINIDDRLIKETLPKIKPNGLAVLLAISIHLNKESGTCFPSHDRLMKLTGLGSDSVYNALSVLKKEGLLVSIQAIDSKNKTFSRRTFRIETDFIGVFVTAKNAAPLPEPLRDLPDTAKPDAVEPDAANHETYLLNESQQLNELEQLNNGGVHAPAPVEIPTVKAYEVKRGLVPPPAESAAAATALTYDQYPNPRNSQQLKEAMRNYFVANPREWQDGVLEQSRATNWPPEKIQDCITAFCAHQEGEGNLKRTYGQYKGMMVKWFLAQPGFDKAKPGASSSQQASPARVTVSTPQTQTR
jgi:hypothetical protein